MNDTNHSPDLQAELLNDDSGRRREDLLAHLRGLHQACLAAQRQLSDRDTYQRLVAASNAVSGAIRIVETLPRRPVGWN
jgi:hypothetical protein